MAARKLAKRPPILFDDFVRVASESALRVVAEQPRFGGSKFNPKIWVGIWIDPIGPRGPGGPLGPGGGPIG
jgi:hypothetical protein